MFANASQSRGPEATSMAGLAPAGFGSLFIKAGALGLQMLIGIVLARQLGPQGLGDYALAMVVIHLAAIGLQLGLGDFLVRSLASARPGVAGRRIRAEIGGAVRMVIFAALALLLIALAVDRAVPAWTRSIPVREVVMIAPAVAIAAILSGALRGLGHVLLGQLPDQWIRPLLMLAVLLIGLPNGPSSAADALTAYVLATLGGLGAAVTLVWWVLPSANGPTEARPNPRIMLAMSFPFLVLAGANMLHHHVDVLMIGLLATQTDVGLYRVVVNIADALQAVLLALSIVIAPRIACLHADGDWQALRRLIAVAHRLALLTLAPLAIATAFLASPIIVTLYGLEFLPAQTAVAVAALGKIAYAAVGFAGLILAMSGSPGVATAIILAAILTNIALNALLIPLFGIAGAATATAISQFGINAAALWWLFRGFERRRLAEVAL